MPRLGIRESSSKQKTPQIDWPELTESSRRRRMEKMAVLRSVCRSAVASLRSSRSAVATGGGSFLLRRHPGAARSFYRASAAAPPSRLGAGNFSSARLMLLNLHLQ
ncbi:hypothetical protein CRG98_009914 [Punica granatum]|uniref:Uncharacterized protein n=1 Tax=Punica granatum TaxID=22663 RepID=A0A2I0KMQ2_PUNGR|nr:hypothetical protein CRG98_009914 [Punica granatum]